MNGYPDGEDDADAVKIALGCFVWIGALAAFAMIVGFFFRACDSHDSGVGRSPEASQPLRLQVDSPNLPASEEGTAAPAAVADAGLSGRVAEGAAPEEILGSSSGGARSSRGLAALYTDYELDPGMEPTWQGLYSMTVELWSQEEFRETTSRYRLPTVEECKAALDDAKVQRLLDKVCYVDLLLVELGPIPRLVAERDALRAALMQRLDEVSTYLEWALMDKLYGEWSH